MFADVGDWVELEPQAETSLRICGPFGPELSNTGSGNLVLAAMAAIERETGCELRAAVTLEKNLPISSGIGGGSADAAAMLRACNGAWRLGFSTRDLMRIGAALGADVPVCVGARSAWMTGIGEAIAPLAAPPLHALLINPRKRLATGDVFREFDRQGLGGAFAAAAAPEWSDIEQTWAAIARNDLEAPARALLPEIAEISEWLRANPRVRAQGLSGSGATMFGLVESAVEAASVAAEMSRARPDWWVCSAILGAA